MPFYEYECPKHGRFTVKQPMSDVGRATCSECGKTAEPRISLSSFRFAEPITLYQDLGRDANGSHRGYQVQGWKADSGVSPKSGQPYKTADEVARER